jgi:hypothetical protein
MELPGGSILNSALLTEEEQSDLAAHNSTYKNLSLKAGIVTKVYEADDESNVSKLGPEYDVLVIEQDEDRSISAIQYKNCMMAESFGNIADFFEFKLRAQTKEEGDGGRNPAKQNGSLVLMLCLDGASEKGIILKALKHPSRKETLTKDKGLHMHGEYNGFNIEVDKEGAFKMTFKGPRDNDGKYSKEGEKAGSFFSIDKEGNMEFNSGNKEPDFIKIDKVNKNIETRAEKDTTISTKENLIMKTDKKSVSIDSGKDFSVVAAGKANMKSDSVFDIEAGGAMSIKAASLKMTIDGSVQVQGSQITLQGMTFLGSAGGTPAVVLTTKTLAIGNLGAPSVGMMIGPFSSNVFIAT